jgi:hypothetical protein
VRPTSCKRTLHLRPLLTWLGGKWPERVSRRGDCGCALGRVRRPDRVPTPAPALAHACTGRWSPTRPQWRPEPRCQRGSALRPWP